MNIDLLQTGYIIMAIVYLVTAIHFPFNKVKAPMSAKLAMSAVCIILGGACAGLAALSDTAGAFYVGIAVAVLSLVEAIEHTVQGNKIRGIGYLAIALLFLIALIKSPVFN